METAVLPAQDHLAQERYRHQSRMMSGMIYPLGGLPRGRRKVRAPPHVFAASLHSENVRVSSNQSVPAVDTRHTPAGAAAQLDLTFGILRGARFSSSPPSRHPSGLSTPQYRLHSTPSQGFTRSESTRSEATSPVKSKQQSAGSAVPPSSTLNGSSTCHVPVVRTRSDGELLGFKKGGYVEKTGDRRRSFEKSSDIIKNGYERKMIDKVGERLEKPVDKRKVFEKKPVEKKVPVLKNQDEKHINAPKKGIITILQRPQTKEAAAENLAKITGMAVLVPQTGKPNRGPQQTPVEVTREEVVTVSTAGATEEFQDTEWGSRDPESGGSHVTKGRPGSPKGGKKRSVRGDSNRASGFRASASNVEKVGRAASGKNDHSARAYFDKEEKVKVSEEKREASPASSHSSREGIGASKAIVRNPGFLNLTQEDYSSAHSPLESQSKKSNAGNIISTEGAYRSNEEHGVKHGVIRSDSFRDIPRRSESCEVILLPSSPPTAAAERWAGPAYSNSPPPSTLPFPTFPTQRAKSSLNGVSLVGVVDPLVPGVVPVKSSSAPSSPTRVSAAFFSDQRTQAREDHMVQAPRVDPSSATKDLKRILNLDVGCTTGMEAEASFVAGYAFRLTSFLKVKEQQSATQSLKRILQLG